MLVMLVGVSFAITVLYAVWRFIVERGAIASTLLARVYDVNTWYCDITSMREFNTMNYGYAPLDGAIDRSLAFPHMLQLYRNVCLDALQSLDLSKTSVVMEIGTGRGGGLAYLHSLLKVGRWVGVDLCQPQIAINKEYYAEVDADLQFMVMDATNLDTVADESVDALINIESSHNYPDFRAFHNSARRVLKPGGKMIYADFEKVVELDQMNAVLKDVWGSAGVSLASDQDITANVFEGLKDSQEERKQLLEKYSPVWVKPWAPHILGLRGSIPFRRLEQGVWVYFKLVLTKPLK